MLGRTDILVCLVKQGQPVEGKKQIFHLPFFIAEKDLVPLLIRTTQSSCFTDQLSKAQMKNEKWKICFSLSTDLVKKPDFCCQNDIAPRGLLGPVGRENRKAPALIIVGSGA